ncbi:MAG: PDR/VanB family oxidoreductase [Actinomycetota bacterium]
MSAMRADEQQLHLVVAAVVPEADGVVSLVFRTQDGSDLPEWGPGSHVDLHLPGVITRQYSLNSSPYDRSTWRISVLLEPESRGGSVAVHNEVHEGDVVEVHGPRNHFMFVESADYFFIAGGIGITPILPMIEEAERAGANWRLMYGGRTRSSMAFLDELAAYGDRVLVRPQDEFGHLDLASWLTTPVEGTMVYACGPGPLLTAVVDLCEAWPPGSLHFERFTAVPFVLPEGESEKSFEVVCEESGITVTVGADQGILQALEGAGLSLPFSCREGTCGTCETGVIEGIPDHRDSYLSEEERSYNDTMMICVGRSLTPRLVLDL